MVDARSAASELFAFQRLGLCDPIVNELTLVKTFVGCKVPEGIFVHPDDDTRRISVEVKRIIGGRLPMDGGGHRVIRRHSKRHGGDKIIWPWTSSVESALTKVNAEITRTYGLVEHHAVFLVPESMTKRTQARTMRHIIDVARMHLRDHPPPCRIRLHMVSGDDDLFERR